MGEERVWGEGNSVSSGKDNKKITFQSVYQSAKDGRGGGGGEERRRRARRRYRGG